MRIAAGKFRGRQLAAPRGRATRPTGARVREALFDILEHGLGTDPPIDGARVLDVFAGAGALGLEALSRGGDHVTFMERDRAACAAIEANVAALGVAGQVQIVRTDATAPRAARTGEAASLVFLDPPYGQGLDGAALTALAAQGWIAAGAMVAVEHDKDDAVAIPPGFAECDRRAYGSTEILFLRFH